MSISNAEERWGTVSKYLHWGTAVIILVQFVTGFLRYFKLISADTWALFYKYWHMPAGVAVLLLVIFRLAWRLAQPHPGLSRDAKWWERLSAQCVHIYLYIAMLLLPLTGWIGFNALKIDVDPLGMALPRLFWDIRPLSFIMADVHLYLAVGLVAALLLHILGALKHHFSDHDQTLIRMLPRGWLNPK